MNRPPTPPVFADFDQEEPTAPIPRESNAQCAAFWLADLRPTTTRPAFGGCR